MKVNFTFGHLLILALALSISSCKKNVKQMEAGNKSFKNILILGNSITFSSSNPSIGWYGNWGMAASVAENDYVHILTRKFIQQNGNAKLTIKTIGDFERDYWEYDSSKLDSVVAIKPDLIIIRIGENIDRNTVDTYLLKKYYSLFIQYLKKSNPNTKILCVGTFWKVEQVENAIKSSCIETNSTYIELSSLGDIPYMAWYEFTDPGVHIHPSDKGMSAIADIIWTEVVKLNSL